MLLGSSQLCHPGPDPCAALPLRRLPPLTQGLQRLMQFRTFRDSCKELSKTLLPVFIGKPEALIMAAWRLQNTFRGLENVMHSLPSVLYETLDYAA